MSHVRYLILLACILSVAVDYVTRLNINVAIVSMVRVHHQSKSITSRNVSTEFGYCQYASKTIVNHSIDIEYEQESNSSSIVDHNFDRYDWSPSQQGFVLGGFFYTYMLMQVPGGRLAERIGGKWVVMVGILLSSVVNVVTPVIASNFAAIVVSRIVLGAAQGGIFAACYNLLCNWFPKSQRAMALGNLETGTRFGTMAATYFAGYLSDNYGWPYVFYVCGAVGFVAFIVLTPLMTSKPEDHRFVSREELDLIRGRTQDECLAIKDPESMLKPETDSNPAVPWIPMITSPRVIALMFARIGLWYTLYFVQTKLPAYLSEILQFTPTEVSNIRLHTNILHHIQLFTDWNFDRSICGLFGGSLRICWTSFRSDCQTRMVVVDSDSSSILGHRRSRHESGNTSGCCS